jgi:hypothetical protein
MFGYTCARLNVRVGRGSFVLAHWLHVSSVTAVSFILTRVEVASGLQLVEVQVGRATVPRTGDRLHRRQGCVCHGTCQQHTTRAVAERKDVPASAAGRAVQESRVGVSKTTGTTLCSLKHAAQCRIASAQLCSPFQLECQPPAGRVLSRCLVAVTVPVASDIEADRPPGPHWQCDVHPQL